MTILLPCGHYRHFGNRASLGIQTHDIQQDSCRYCHSEPAEGEVAQAIATQGYFIWVC